MTETPSNQQPCPLCLGNPNTYYENEGRVCTICQGVGRVPAPEFGTLAEHGRIVEADMTPNKKLTTPAPDIDTTIKSLKDNGLPEMAALAEDLKKIEAAPEPNQIYSVPTAFVDTPAPSEQLDIGGFLKKYMDVDGKGDMELMGRMSYELMRMMASEFTRGFEKAQQSCINNDCCREAADKARREELEAVKEKYELWVNDTDGTSSQLGNFLNDRLAALNKDTNHGD